jgi:hypothetical protein
VLLESCEILLKETGDDRYRALIEDFARRQQVLIPHPWAAAYEARYAGQLDARQLAIGAASFLDSRSPKISHITQVERDSLKRVIARYSGPLGAAARTQQRLKTP